MCVKHYVAAKSITGFPNMARDTGVAICPSITDISGVIVYSQSSVNYPAPSHPSAMWCDHGQEWHTIVNRMIQRDRPGLNLG